MRRLTLIASLATLGLIGAPVAHAQDVPSAAEAVLDPADAAAPKPARQGEQAPAKVRIVTRGDRNGRVDVGRRVLGVGFVRPFVADQEVRVWVAMARQELVARKMTIKKVPGQNRGRFKIRSRRLIEDGAYRIRARKNDRPHQEGFTAESRRLSVRYPDLDPGRRSNAVRLFNTLLAKQGYDTGRGRGYGSATGRAVLAFRKVNRMSRSQNATPAIFRTLANGRGGFKLKYPGAGKHVEADLSRQVMVLAAGGKALHIYHVSSGAPATPTIRGRFTFFRKQYGKNSLGMVHSVYFGPTNKGYATHGYHSVPTYPASHGCLRNPIPNSLFIYNWINLGDTIYVYP